ncbi:MAG: EpsI family protein [bacterium]|nr:EpsI family protein [bacterium]
MRSLRVRVAAAMVLLGVAAGVSALGFYQGRMERGAPQAEKLPLVIGPWIGTPVAVEDYVKRILETDDVVQRNYLNARFGVMPVQLAVVFSHDNRRVAHPPEVCYRGAGWEVQESRTIEPEGAPPLVRLILGSGSRRDMVLYCYLAGSRLTANYYRQQYNIVVNQVMRRATSSALIRFSSPIDADERATEERILDFVRAMMPEICKTLN